MANIFIQLTIMCGIAIDCGGYNPYIFSAWPSLNLSSVHTAEHMRRATAITINVIFDEVPDSAHEYRIQPFPLYFVFSIQYSRHSDELVSIGRLVGVHSMNQRGPLPILPVIGICKHFSFKYIIKITHCD